MSSRMITALWIHNVSTTSPIPRDRNGNPFTGWKVEYWKYGYYDEEDVSSTEASRVNMVNGLNLPLR
jgi:hypothetical protein